MKLKEAFFDLLLEVGKIILAAVFSAIYGKDNAQTNAFDAIDYLVLFAVFILIYIAVSGVAIGLKWLIPAWRNQKRLDESNEIVHPQKMLAEQYVQKGIERCQQLSAQKEAIEQETMTVVSRTEAVEMYVSSINNLMIGARLFRDCIIPSKSNNSRREKINKQYIATIWPDGMIATIYAAIVALAELKELKSKIVCISGKLNMNRIDIEELKDSIEQSDKQIEDASQIYRRAIERIRELTSEM